MKILYTTTIGLTMGFFKPFIRSLLDEGHTVDIATNDSKFKVDECYKNWGCNIYPISWSRSPMSIGNIRAIKEVRELVSDRKYDIIHCHTPIAAACTRFACKGIATGGARIMYTAHGFHFYNGAPLLNWLLYYPVEKWLSGYTDVLITVNKEDYSMAQKKIKAKKIEYVPGVGIDVTKHNDHEIDKNQKRAELGISDSAFIVLSVGELNKNKNHRLIIEAIARSGIESIIYIICGRGPLERNLKDLAKKLGIEHQVIFLGFRTDIPEIMKAADLFAFPSFREGLSVSLMEAMASGLPVVCSNIRGNTDLIIHDEGGYTITPTDVFQASQQIMRLYEDPAKRTAFAEYNREVIRNFTVDVVTKKMTEIYRLERKT